MLYISGNEIHVSDSTTDCGITYRIVDGEWPHFNVIKMPDGYVPSLILYTIDDDSININDHITVIQEKLQQDGYHQSTKLHRQTDVLQKKTQQDRSSYQGQHSKDRQNPSQQKTTLSRESASYSTPTHKRIATKRQYVGHGTNTNALPSQQSQHTLSLSAHSPHPPHLPQLNILLDKAATHIQQPRSQRPSLLGKCPGSEKRVRQIHSVLVHKVADHARKERLPQNASPVIPS